MPAMTSWNTTTTAPLSLPDVEAAGGDQVEEKLFDAASMMSDQTATLGANKNTDAGIDDDDFDIDTSFFGANAESDGSARRWNSARNAYDLSKDPKFQKGPLKLRVRDVHVIWNLFDGYDWQHTRNAIAKTVQEVEAKAYERKTRNRRRSGYEQDFEEEETVIGDFLFNSIYIGIPANHDPKDLAQAINQNIYGGDTTSETESVAATTVTATSRPILAASPVEVEEAQAGQKPAPQDHVRVEGCECGPGYLPARLSARRRTRSLFAFSTSKSSTIFLRLPGRSLPPSTATRGRDRRTRTWFASSCSTSNRFRMFRRPRWS